MINSEHVEVIYDFWQRGGALLWGDNQPYYADANLVMKRLFGGDFTMAGNLPRRPGRA